MTIATWNLERLKYIRDLTEIIFICENLEADVLILTEYDERVDLRNYPFQISTRSLGELDAKFYKPTEKCVQIYSKYEIINQHQTYDKFTSCCAEIETGLGKLNVYGTIIGILGNRCENFKTDLPKQIDDFRKFSKGQNLCVAGDFNITFGDNYYFTHLGRYELAKAFEENGMINLTYDLAENIDHIAISRDFIKEMPVELFEWNIGKNLSDHKGVGAKLTLNI